MEVTNFTNFAVWQLWLLLLVGLALLFVGYRIKKIAFFIIWFVLGYMLMTYFMPTLNEWVPEIKNSDLWQWLLPLAGGLLLALMGFSIEKLCLGGACFALVMAATVEYFGTEMQTLVIGAVIGVIAAGFAVTMMKPATIVAVSATGAYCATVAITTLAPGLSTEVWYWPLLIALTLVGSLVQFKTTKHIS